MVSKFNITEEIITVGCNGLDVIRMALDQHSSYTCQYNHFDILAAINNSKEQSRITWNCIHFKGHQDNHVEPLERWVTLNVLCNTADKQLWEEDQELRYIYPSTVKIMN